MMKRTLRRCGAALAATSALAAILGLAAPALATPLSYDDSLDIGALLTTAAKHFDLAQEDAVLLERTDTVRWLADGRRELAVHEIVWIRTEHAIDTYADLRVPYDGARCDLVVDALRTWRDDRWWVSTDTAVVETLPRALTSADDYVHLREMMLLHDGVEIPCVMETAYRIVDREPFRPAGDGIQLLARRDPAVRSRFVLAVPPGTEPHLDGGSLAGAPVRGRDDARGLETVTWSLENVPRRPRPFPAGAVVALPPRVLWSTWTTPEALDAWVTARLADAIVLDDVLRDSVATIVARTPVALVRAHRIAEFLKRTTRTVAYAPDFALASLRPAHRTWQTAYGTTLDRVVLATALFREAGFEAHPVWWMPSSLGASPRFPALFWYDGPKVTVQGPGVWRIFDPSAATLESVGTAFRGGRTWRPEVSPRQSTIVSRDEGLSRVDVQVDLARDEETGGWKGSGVYSAAGMLSPYAGMAGLEGDGTDRLKGIVAGVVPGAKVVSSNPVVFEPDHVALAFEVVVPKPEKDDYGRLPLPLGEPAHGLVDALPSDVHLQEASRETPIESPHTLAQSVRVVLDVTGLDVVRAPEADELANEAGTFRLTAERRPREDRDELVVGRDLSLKRDAGRAAWDAREWPAIRALLLADRDPRARAILLRPEKKKAKKE